MKIILILKILFINKSLCNFQDDFIKYQETNDDELNYQMDSRIEGAYFIRENSIVSIFGFKEVLGSKNKIFSIMIFLFSI
ncbi:Hypothetical protein KVN_LOCUS121 [uncultured virus]|nr:Hypothetical protein KVN_LOCUS121 [uncultured virus]